MERNLRKNFLNALHGNPVDMTPALSVTQTGTVELMDLTGAAWPAAHSDPEKMTALALAGHEIAGLEAVRYPYCLTVLAETMGCNVRMGTKDIQPSVLSHPFSEGPDKLKVPEALLEKGRIPTILKATEILATRTGGENGKEEVPLIAGMEGPLTIFTHLAEVKNYLIWTIRKPEYVNAFMETCTEICIEYANALFDHGADALCMPDGGIVGSRMMPPSVLEDSVKPFYKRLCKKVKGPVILHICGDVGDSLKTLSECGFEAISIEEKASIKAAKEAIGGRARLIGNVSPSRTMLFGTPADVKAEAKQCLSAGVDILAPGCGIAPRTPLANIRALVEARDEWYEEKE
ncbi:methylcobamide:CoM methyltransferase [Methanosarcina sp. 2.H.T.1A.6]|uniref:methylcobamide:CoM methyltransferase MtaA n=1 Tax=unclassified Methanosarcina TaxID=2644672 RepID=UPI00062234CD|nr:MULTISPECIES: methylcobamide:CoM methyltransferase MtaA [unclassified Methanosarcina]KKG09873.1 methylcobamide:CoM methyltransferase [Methanosarcina sp. 2.H.T.1A.15]KKG17695.1 methylcobamide:CoM methyltransferase [Methanosarcina sp. 2.H.T.1A.3]KKG21935.1 methylcobamide:CoM methyltransferase [Methanosarcina sp. 2.H.T.1A.6]KKG25471.1 methylcobamide:CoM methyltransferase [Methanosarcina sp. 2.H.T.1A.8]